MRTRPARRVARELVPDDARARPRRRARRGGALRRRRRRRFPRDGDEARRVGRIAPGPREASALGAPGGSEGQRTALGEAEKPRGPTCPHGKADRGYFCRECPGKGICKHGRRRPKCKECKGCPHGKADRGYFCRECPGKGICKHGRQRPKCKECKGAGICVHGRVRSRCKECRGGSICDHGRRRSQCKECRGGSICKHGKQRYRCRDCGGGGICEHGRERNKCRDCGGSGAAAAAAFDEEELDLLAKIASAVGRHVEVLKEEEVTQIAKAICGGPSLRAIRSIRA